MGLLMVIIVTSASVQDRDGAKLLLPCLEGSCKKLRRIWVDGGYRGALLGWVSEQFRFVLQVIMRSDEQKGFHVLPRRWVVERTFAWLNHNRRLCKDYEVLPETSETMIYLAMIHIMLRRLASWRTFRRFLSVYISRWNTRHLRQFTLHEGFSIIART